MPVLHTLALHVNTLFDFLTFWVWNQLENNSIELVEARFRLANASNAVDKVWEFVLDTEEHVN